MNRLPTDIKWEIFRLVSLEDCLSLSQVSQSFREAWINIDANIVRTKVLDRVPWFTLNDADTELTTWTKCAHVTVARSAKSALQFGTSSSPLIPIKSLEYPFGELNNDPVRVKSTDVSCDIELRESMEPLFDAEFKTRLPETVQRGTSLHVSGKAFDLKPLTVEESNHKKTRKEPMNYQFGLTKRGNLCTSPSGIVVRHRSLHGKVHVLAENDIMLLVRHTTERSGQDPHSDEEDVAEYWESQQYFDEGDVDCLIHKPSYPRDRNDMIVIDPKKTIKLFPQFECDKGNTLINLLPGKAGALVQKNTTSETCSSFLGYIEPTEEQRHVILCTLPLQRELLAMEYPKFSVPYWLSYNGYLFFQYEGRIFRFWVDLGFQKPLELLEPTQKALGLDKLPQKTFTRALTAFSPKYPSLGTFIIHGMMYRDSDLVRGERDKGLDRYVSFVQTEGRIVGDLLTGKTYFVRDEANKHKICIPFKSDTGVGFYSVHSSISSVITKMLGKSTEEKLRADFDKLAVYSYGKPEPSEKTNNFGYEKNDIHNHPRRVRPTRVFVEHRVSQYVNKYGTALALEDQKEDMDKPVDDEDDEDEDDEEYDSEEYETDSEEEDEESDIDWDLDGQDLRLAYAHEYLTEDEEEVPGPINYYKAGYDDAAVKKRKDTRYKNSQYHKGFHAGFRAINGFENDSDEDHYMGSNPSHACAKPRKIMNHYYMGMGF